MTKLKELKREVLFLANEMKHNKELCYDGRYLIDDVSKVYELKLLKQLHNELYNMIEGLKGFNLEVKELDYIKLDIMEARIKEVKRSISETNKVNRMIAQ